MCVCMYVCVFLVLCVWFSECCTFRVLFCVRFLGCRSDLGSFAEIMFVCFFLFFSTHGFAFFHLKNIFAVADSDN